VVQGVILLSITFVVMPLALGLVGGPAKLIASLPALSFDHWYNGVHYTEHWLVSIFIIMGLGTAAGAAQRFYSVKDERDAKRVGKLAGGLFLTVPFVFGVPPLVAKVIWPDLSQIDFFKPYIGSNPQDLVFIGLTMKLLPNGLIGVFLAAMLAATMSSLSSVYNMVSSILSRDIYQGWIRPETNDRELLTVGRVFSILLGLLVTVLAVVFVNSEFGIFNLMQAFFTLLNIPVVVPTAFGLLFRRVPKWSAVSSIFWGLVVGLTTRYVLGWDIGPQVYLAFVTSFGIFAASYWLGRQYRSQKLLLSAIALVIGIIFAGLFLSTFTYVPAFWEQGLAVGCAAVLAVSLYLFARLFSIETDAEREAVENFFRKLDTPVDVAREVFGAGRKQVSTFPLVGGTTIVMGLLMCLVFLTDMSPGERTSLGIIIGIMVTFGILMWYFVKKSEIRSATEYSKKVE
jgi:Na+/proline symporter